MIRVTTGSRLHFGLFHLPDDRGDAWANLDGEPTLPARRFGGVGLMIDRPSVQLSIQQATEWSAEGPSADRALAFARRLADRTPPCHITVEACPPEHRGLGSGTQLALAVARGVMAAAGLSPGSAVGLASRVGRGVRSALGIHGFDYGGFLVEAGQREPGQVAPLVVRVDFPESWRIVLIVPEWGPGLHGKLEQDAFARLPAPSPAWTDSLCRLVLLGMLPALAERDLTTFGEALFDFNARVGEAFAPVQGGRYAGERIRELVTFIRHWGVRGVGQSSWGPAVFGIAGHEAEAERLAEQIKHRFSLGAHEVMVTRARNEPANLVFSG